MKRELIAIVLTLSVLIMLTSCSETTTEPITDTDPPQALPVPVFDPPSGTYSTSQEVSISCEVEGATIRYIILDSPDDEGKVTELSSGYEEPLLVSQSQFIKAKAYKEGWLPSEVSTGTYTVTETVITVGSFTLTVAPETIYADNGISYATVKAEVKDENDFPIVGFPVKFKCSPTGRIASDILTDHFGVATVNYSDTGVESDNVTITARIADEERTVSVEVLPAPEVYGISFVQIPVTVSLNSVFTVTATAYSAPNEPFMAGYPMIFSADKGGFLSGDDGELKEQVIVPTDDRGIASVRWNSGSLSGEATLNATIAGSDISASAETYIRPGQPKNIFVSSMVRLAGRTYWEELPAVIPTDFQLQDNAIRVFAHVVDEYNNSANNGNPILFETDLGTIHPIKPTERFRLYVKDPGTGHIVEKQFNGTAWSVFTLGASAGTAVITASTMDREISGETRILIESYDIQSISFAQQGAIYLDVSGVGGVETRQLLVELKDSRGNLIADPPAPELPALVKFEILDDSAPEGININNQGLSDQVRANNGVASVSLNSGTGSGRVSVRASIADEPTIQATKSNIIVRSGPPERIELFAAGVNQGVAVAGGIWKMRVGAHVTDRQGNGITPGMLVNFSLEGDTPQGTNIESAAYVGADEDDDWGGSGIALVWLYYHGTSTNIPVTVRAQSGDVINEKSFKLPLQYPELDLSASVGQIRFFSAAGWPQAHYVEVVATVNDGQGNLIAGQEVELTSSQGDGIHHGLAIGDYQGDRPNIIITHIGGVNYQRLHPIAPGMPLGPPQDWPDGDKRPPHTTISERGRAYSIVAVHGNELPPPDVEEWFTQVDNQITARIIGTDAIAQTSFTMFRYHPSAPPFK